MFKKKSRKQFRKKKKKKNEQDIHSSLFVFLQYYVTGHLQKDWARGGPDILLWTVSCRGLLHIDRPQSKQRERYIYRFTEHTNWRKFDARQVYHSRPCLLYKNVCSYDDELELTFFLFFLFYVFMTITAEKKEYMCRFGKKTLCKISLPSLEVNVANTIS